MPANVDSMFYVQNEGLPWHGLGIPLKDPVPPSEAFVVTGLNVRVEKRPIYVNVEGKYIPVRDKQATVWMSDPPEALGVVSPKYRILQQAEMAEFLDNLCKEGGIQIHTAGSLSGHTRIWLMGKYPKQIEVVPGDLIDCNLFGINSHDGSLRFSCGAAAVRIVCENTAFAAINEADTSGRLLQVRHTGQMTDRLDEARIVLGLLEHAFKRHEEQMRTLAGVGMTDEQVDEVLHELIPDPAEDASNAKAEAMRDFITSIWQHSDTIDIPGVRGTAYGFYCAITEWVDHYRGKSSTTDRRLTSAWLGTGAALKDAALWASLSLAAQ